MLSPTLLNTVTANPAPRLNPAIQKQQDGGDASFQAHLQQQVNRNKPENQQNCKNDSGDREAGQALAAPKKMAETEPRMQSGHQADTDTVSEDKPVAALAPDKVEVVDIKDETKSIDRHHHGLGIIDGGDLAVQVIPQQQPAPMLPLEPVVAPVQPAFMLPGLQAPGSTDKESEHLTNQSGIIDLAPERGWPGKILQTPEMALIPAGSQQAGPAQQESDVNALDTVKTRLLFVAGNSLFNSAIRQQTVAGSVALPAEESALAMTPAAGEQLQTLVDMQIGMHNLMGGGTVGKHSANSPVQMTLPAVPTPTAGSVAALEALIQTPLETAARSKAEHGMSALLATGGTDISTLMQQNTFVERTQSRALTPPTLAAPMASQTLAPDFVNRFSDQVMWLRHQNINIAELRLHPRDLGSVLVRIDSSGDNTSVNFVAGHQHVRDVLDQNMTKLRELFNDAGLNLGNVNVSSESPSQKDRSFQGSSDSYSSGVQQRFNTDDREISSASVDASVLAPATAIHIVDFFA